MMNNKILIIDDEIKLRQLLTRIISLEGIEVSEANNCKEALQLLSKQCFEVIICDVKLPDGSGVDLLTDIKKLHPASEVILLTAYGNIKDGVQAMKNGAFDYLTKGDDNDKIIPLLHRAFEQVNLRQRIAHLEKQVAGKYSFDTILGESVAIKNTIELAKKVAPTDASVLLLGETGTGKEVFAQAIHYNSKRVGKPFIALNCSAFSKELLESEIFGHKTGAFTGAVKDKKGLIEEASGGTLLLDEIGEMHIDLQAKLLRVLENGEFIKVGDTKTVKVNVRIIAATNRKLEVAIKEGSFREDLFYRLNVFSIMLPSLNDRKKDIAQLARHFTMIFATKMNKKINHIEDSFIQHLEQHNWKGNIRELKNIIERAVILSNDDSLTTEQLPIDLQEQIPQKNNHLSAFDLSSVEKLHIQRVLNYTKGNKTETARLLNIGLTTLYRKIEEYKIQM